MRDRSPTADTQAILHIKVAAGSSNTALAGWLGDTLKMRVTAMPEKGRANAAIIALLSERLAVPKHRIRIKSGHSSSRKSVLIDGVSAGRLQLLLSGPNK